MLFDGGYYMVPPLKFHGVPDVLTFHLSVRDEFVACSVTFVLAGCQVVIVI